MESDNLGLASWPFSWLGRLFTSNLSKASSSWPLVLFVIHIELKSRCTRSLSKPSSVQQHQSGPTLKDTLLATWSFKNFQKTCIYHRFTDIRLRSENECEILALTECSSFLYTSNLVCGNVTVSLSTYVQREHRNVIMLSLAFSKKRHVDIGFWRHKHVLSTICIFQHSPCTTLCNIEE